MAKLKVFGGLLQGRGKPQVRTIVAASSKKRAAELVGCSVPQFSKYWSETFNTVEVETATDQPEKFFQASSTLAKDFEPVDIN